MVAAALSSLACPLRRSTRLAHAHTHAHTHTRPPRPAKPRPPARDPDLDHDSSSSDPENELTPRALRALKRQRLALDLDGLPFDPRARPKKRRKENIPRPSRPPPSPQCSKHLSEPLVSPLTPKRAQAADWQASSLSLAFSLSLTHPSPHSIATTNAASMPSELVLDPSRHAAILHGDSSKDMPGPEFSTPPDPLAPSAVVSDSTSPEPLTPLTPLTPSPESSPSLPGHDRQALPLPPSHDPLPPPVSLDPLPVPSSADPSSPILNQFPLPSDSFRPSPPANPISLDPALNTLIPFDGLHPPFDPDLSVQIPPASCPPPAPPELQGLELQEPFHSFPQQQLYVPPSPVFVRDREINIWKLACQERVDCLLRRYGIDYIKALVKSQAHTLSQDIRSAESPSSIQPSQTKFRLYTPASYTYSSTSWGSTPGTRKAFSPDDDSGDLDPVWPMDDADWADADVDMEDEDEDDYEDDDDAAEPELEREGEGESTLGAAEGSDVAATPPKVDAPLSVAMEVDDVLGKSEKMQVDESIPAGKATASSELPVSSRSVPPAADPPLRPLTPLSHAFPPPPAAALSLPPLSSLHVPLLSEPPRAFMGRGTPPDRRRLIEWSGSARFATNGIGPPLYLSPVPQRHVSPDMVPMVVDSSPIQSGPSHPSHTHGEWTSFLYSMLEGDGVGVGVSTGVGNPSHASEPTWYELGLGSVPTVVTENALELPLSQPLPPVHGRPPAVEQPIEEGNNSSSTLRFALG